MRAFVLATGPSLTPAQVEAVRDRGLVVAVSNAVQLAPWADVLVSTDAAWWSHHRKAALKFAGRRIAAVTVPDSWAGHDPALEWPLVERFLDVPRDINSGLLAVRVAAAIGATTIVLLGIDLHGSHFFGPHPDVLKNSTPDTFRAMARAFAQYRPEGVEIVNCSPGSALDCYPRGNLADWR